MTETEFEVCWNLNTSESDFTSAWKPDGIFIAMQEAAATHATNLGAGFQPLLKKNLAWVITRIRLQMTAYPTYQRPVSLKTWTGKERHGIYTRLFSISDENGSLIGAANVSWALMHLLERRKVSPEESGVLLPESGLPPLCPPPKAVRIPEDAPAQVTRRTPVYSEIDVNGHLNNTHYISWFCDLLPRDFFRTRQFSEITINYLHEIRPADEVTLSLYDLSDNRLMLSGFVGDVPCFLLEATKADKRLVPLPPQNESGLS